MANKTIYLMGIVKENAKKTLYVDTAEGRVFLGKISGFVKGQELMGEAVCTPRKIDYPARPAVGVVGDANYQPATLASTADGWQMENFYTEEMLAKKAEFATRKAQAAFTTAKINRATTALATVEINSTADVFALVG